jgi:hypothetical protein
MAHWPITLHAAMQVVLCDEVNQTATTNVVSDQINTRRLYVQKDRGQVFPKQIFLRARKYPALFRLHGNDVIESLQKFTIVPVPPLAAARKTAKHGKPQSHSKPTNAKIRMPREKTIQAKNDARRRRQAQLAEARREEQRMGAVPWNPPATRPTMPEEL